MLRLTDALGAAGLSETYFQALAAGSMVSASLVCTDLGAFVNQSGNSSGIGGSQDRNWLLAMRANSQVVLTSGKTFRAEGYRMPSGADLAVLTGVGVDITGLDTSGRTLHILQDVSGYADSVVWLQAQGYSRIHVEFGPTGIGELLDKGLIQNLWLSSVSEQGLKLGAAALGCALQLAVSTDQLFIGLARKAAWQLGSGHFTR